MEDRRFKNKEKWQNIFVLIDRKRNYVVVLTLTSMAKMSIKNKM
jgi:hypothetical protein